MEQPGYEVMADTYAELFTEAFGTPLYSCPGSGDYATRVTYLSRARAATIVASTNSTTPWPAPGAGILTLSPTPQRLRIQRDLPHRQPARQRLPTLPGSSHRGAQVIGAPASTILPDCWCSPAPVFCGRRGLEPHVPKDTGT